MTMDASNTIILCAGRIDQLTYTVGTNVSHSMMPLNGKPVIGWILDDLLKKNIRQATIVHHHLDSSLPLFVKWAYSRRMQIVFISPPKGGTIIESLMAGMNASPKPLGTVRILLGDTLIRDSFVGDESFLYLAEVDDPSRWCMAATDFKKNNQIVCLFEKEKELPVPTMAVAGYYHFSDGQLLTRCVEECLSGEKSELSSVMNKYMKYEPIYSRKVKEWFDFGHIDKFIEAKRNLIGARYFNSIKVDPTLNTLTKISANTQKLRDELYWYKNIPDPLKVLTPRILLESGGGNLESLEIVQEYYGYPNLGELYLYSDIDTGTWKSIITKLFLIHGEFCRHKGSLSRANIESIYIEKTFSRIAELYKQDDFWSKLLSQDYIYCNGLRLRNINKLKDDIVAYSTNIVDNCDISISHGDFCLSNILYDLGNQIVRLVDPRGRFGKQTIFGDPRYDISKLSHSICGFYDFIIADLFNICDHDGRFEYEIFNKGEQAEIVSIFIDEVIKYGYDIDEIKFIEGLLFLSMIPLHSDHCARQKIMFLKGLEILNDVLE